MEETRKDRIQLLVRRICLIITDILLVNGCVFLSLLMRFEISISAIPEEYLLKYQKNMIPFTIVAIIIFWCFRMYHSLWQYASIAELYCGGLYCNGICPYLCNGIHGLDASKKLLFYIRGIFNRCNECQPFYVPHDTYRLAELPPHRRAGADYDYRCG